MLWTLPLLMPCSPYLLTFPPICSNFVSLMLFLYIYYFLLKINLMLIDGKNKRKKVETYILITLKNYDY